MKPYGRENKLQGFGKWKTDVHPPKGLVNWWENICDLLSRSRMKQISKKEINREISENL
jgi:hypothetical protein